jgi:hypothetical protein
VRSLARLFQTLATAAVYIWRRANRQVLLERPGVAIVGATAQPYLLAQFSVHLVFCLTAVHLDLRLGSSNAVTHLTSQCDARQSAALIERSSHMQLGVRIYPERHGLACLYGIVQRGRPPLFWQSDGRSRDSGQTCDGTVVKFS